MRQIYVLIVKYANGLPLLQKANLERSLEKLLKKKMKQAFEAGQTNQIGFNYETRISCYPDFNEWYTINFK